MRWVAVVSLLLAVVACGSPSPPPAVSSTTQAPPPRDPVVQCADRLLYWLDRIRTSPDASGLDYQSMGLTGAEYEELIKLRELPPAPTPPTAEATAACTRLEALPKPSTGSAWPG
ncbi:hypothetical protein [Umezawaea sp.]|uniref:hypothetical protein n=1 Tax=Umezawaea sp. TaxID=1955258 RepID=UPI002ED1EE7D